MIQNSTKTNSKKDNIIMVSGGGTEGKEEKTLNIPILSTGHRRKLIDTI